MASQNIKKYILIYTVSFFILVAVVTWIVAVFTPVDYVATTDYIVIDTGRELMILVKPGKCVSLSKIYLPLDTPRHIMISANLTEITPSSLTSVLDVVNVIGNITLEVLSGTYNATTMEICSGYVVIRYAK